MTTLHNSFAAKKIIEQALASGRVAGFEVFNVEESNKTGECVSDYYAPVGGGVTITARVSALFNEFNPAGTVWTVCDGVPEDAEYVGIYPRPQF